MLGDRGGKSGADEEDLQDKKAELELQYKKLQLGLHDILDRNEALTIENKGKDLVLAVKEKELVDLTARNALEVEQLLLEQTCLVEDLNHQLEMVSGHVVRSELRKERHLILSQENVSISEAIQQLRRELVEHNEVHAREIHRLNVFMKNERIRMENLFRSELISMDMAFQNQAFLELDDSRKQAMFANTKLKDELGLLSVGLSALGVRYEKDTRCARDARSNLDDLETSGRALQTAVKSLMTLKVGKRETINQIKQDIKLFKQKKTELDDVLSTGASIPQLEKTLFQTDVLVGREERAIAMWKERKRLIGLLHKEFMTATFSGGQLLFSSTSRSLASVGVPSRNNSLTSTAKSLAIAQSCTPECSSVPSLTKSRTDVASSTRTAGDSLVSIATMDSSMRGSVAPLKTSASRTVSGINLRTLSATDKELKKGLRKLVGKESMLLDAHNENPDTNVTAWTTAQIVDIFSTTYEQWKVTSDAVESQLATIAADAEKEERRLQEAEDQRLMAEACAENLSQGSKSSSKQLSQASLEKIRSSRNLGDSFRMDSSSSDTSSSESDISDEEEHFVDKSMNEIIGDMEKARPAELIPAGSCDDEDGDVPSPLFLEVSSSGYNTPGLPSVRFRPSQDMKQLVSPSDSSAPTVKAGSLDYYANLQDYPMNVSFNNDTCNSSEDCDYDKNGLIKSYSAGSVIRQAQLDKMQDAERRSSYVGFSQNVSLDQLLLLSQSKIDGNGKKRPNRHKVDLQAIKVSKKNNFLDDIEPPLATRQHLKTNVDISKLLDPRVLKSKNNSILQGSKTDSNLSSHVNGRLVTSFPSNFASSNQIVNHSESGLGRDSDRNVSSDTLGRKNILNMVNVLKHTNDDPLSGKATREFVLKKL